MQGWVGLDPVEEASVSMMNKPQQQVRAKATLLFLFSTARSCCFVTLREFLSGSRSGDVAATVEVEVRDAGIDVKGRICRKR